MGEEGEGGERVGGCFYLAGAVLEEVGFVGGEVGRGCDGAVSSAFGSAGAAFGGSRCWGSFCVCCWCFRCIVILLLLFPGLLILVDLLREDVFLLNAVVIAQVACNCALDEIPRALAARRSVCINDEGVLNFRKSFASLRRRVKLYFLLPLGLSLRCD